MLKNVQKQYEIIIELKNVQNAQADISCRVPQLCKLHIFYTTITFYTMINQSPQISPVRNVQLHQVNSRCM